MSAVRSYTNADYRSQFGRDLPPAVRSLVDEGAEVDAGIPASTRTPDFELTDVGNAQRLIARHADRLRYCARFRRWYAWTGPRYEVDERGVIDQLCVETVRAMRGEAAGIVGDKDKAERLFSHALRSESNRAIENMIKRASKLPGVYVSPDDLDADPWLFNVRNGTLNLRTGELQPHRRSDLITKLAPVDYHPLVACPEFLKFLRRIYDGNENLIGFTRRLFGYCMTGSTSERSMFILHGAGANGKSTLIGLLRYLLGDYAIQTSAGVLMARKSEGIPNDIARMKGARLVSAVETDEGRRLAEALIKQLTGGEDHLTGRFLYAEHFDFKPEFKLFVATNHKPEVRGTDPAIWDRLKLIPFDVRIPEGERDPHLLDKLKAEASGILAWAVAGCLEWQRDGLLPPAEVRAATDDYRVSMDKLGEFIADACEVGEHLEAGATPLYDRFKIWCQLRGEEPMNQTRFGRQLDDRGFKSGRCPHTGRTVRLGIGTRVSDVPEGF